MDKIPRISDEVECITFHPTFNIYVLHTHQLLFFAIENICAHVMKNFKRWLLIINAY